MIYLMRHGADPSHRCGGWSTYGLTEEGKKQVHNAKGGLCNKGITQIFSSDLTLQERSSTMELTEAQKEIIYHMKSRQSTEAEAVGVILLLRSNSNQKAMLTYLRMNPTATPREIVDKAVEMNRAEK